MSPLAEVLLADIDKDTVDWRPNYDASKEEPMVLPARVPSLLLNGDVILICMAPGPPTMRQRIVAAVEAVAVKHH